jgi:hypothetical protein
MINIKYIRSNLVHGHISSVKPLINTSELYYVPSTYLGDRKSGLYGK